MDSAFTYSLYAVMAVLLSLSFFKDKEKTVSALKRAWTMFIGVLTQFIAILLLIGLLLAVVTPDTIQSIIGAKSGIGGMILASLLGSITLVPALIAFPIAAELLANGAGMAQIAVFISTLTTVGLVTLPMEIKYLGKKAAILRNSLAYLFAIATAFVMGAVLS